MARRLMRLLRVSLIAGLIATVLGLPIIYFLPTSIMHAKSMIRSSYAENLNGDGVVDDNRGVLMINLQQDSIGGGDNKLREMMLQITKLQWQLRHPEKLPVKEIWVREQDNNPAGKIVGLIVEYDERDE